MFWPWRAAAKRSLTFEGTAEGRIIGVGRGEGGFGYDPLFQPNGYEKTFAVLFTSEKTPSVIRATAAAQLRSFLKTARTGRVNTNPGQIPGQTPLRRRWRGRRWWRCGWSARCGTALAPLFRLDFDFVADFFNSG